MTNNIFEYDLKNTSGGVIIADFIKGKQVIILGKSNNPREIDTYESFGGKKEKEDLTSLHTAIREFTEEFFNIKINTDIINDIALGLRVNNLIIKQQNFFGISYLINFKGLNFIFQKIYSYLETLSNNPLKNYQYNNKFNLRKYMEERTIDEKPSNGLNEIKKIEVFKLEDLLHNNVKLRWFTKKILYLMFIK
jgi:hypothetical protein